MVNIITPVKCCTLHLFRVEQGHTVSTGTSGANYTCQAFQYFYYHTLRSVFYVSDAVVSLCKCSSLLENVDMCKLGKQFPTRMFILNVLNVFISINRYFFFSHFSPLSVVVHRVFFIQSRSLRRKKAGVSICEAFVERKGERATEIN